MSMSEEHRIEVKEIGDEIDAYLTDDERSRLISNLHRILCWVGVQVPDSYKANKETIEKELERDDVHESDLPPEVHLKEGSIDLRNLIWRLVNEKEITEKEKVEVEGLIDLLQSEEKRDEAVLKEQTLTHHQAREIFDQTAGIIRSLLDLKELLSNKEKTDSREKAIRRKVDDAKRWNDFVKRVKNED
jgi:hypothetical protein